MSFFASNPFSTPVGKIIQAVTDASNDSENWSAFMNVCDIINETEDGPRDAIKAFKKRFSSHTGKNYSSIMYTLTLLETCVKNCGIRFHVVVAQKDFLQEMVKIIGPKNDPPQVVQEKVLSLIQTWADAFQGQPDLKEVAKMYQDLKHKGVDFPMTDLDSMAPIHTPARTDWSSPAHTGSPPARPAPTNPAMMQPPATHVLPQQQQQQQQQAQPQQGPITLTPAQLAKIKSEFDVVQQNCKVFSEMLTEMSSGQEHPSDDELLRELNQTCRQMQQRLVELVDRVQNEEVTGEILHINDELNNVFLRYDRYERMRNSAAPGSNPPPSQPPTAANLPPPYPVTQTTPQPPSQPSANLIDLDIPSPNPQPAFTQPPIPPVGGGLSAQLAGMSLNDSSVTNTLGQLDTTVATNSNQDEFDMFAQSRQTFDQNKQTPAAYNAEDQFAGGLGAAVNAKSTGNTADLDDNEGDYNEMESWLRENPGAGGQVESATSSEFDRFLAERAKEAENLPDAGPNVNRGGRQLQKDDQDAALFAL